MMSIPDQSPTNPFRYGGLALGDAFADREDEVAELTRDVANGQDVVIFAPRRYGKTSLVWNAVGELAADDTLVAYVNLMTTPTKETLAEKLAGAIYDDVASRVARVAEKAMAPFRGLRVSPRITVNPDDGTYAFSFGVSHSAADIDATIERLLELPGEVAEARGRRVALVLDEFQEIDAIDPGLPRILRSTFERQPDVARVYLGSRRHMMERIFSDRNEPFWRSAKRVELGPIAPAKFAPFIAARFRATGKRIDEATVAEVLSRTGGHPYATQELCYFLWERTPADGQAGTGELDGAEQAVLRSEQAHFEARWEEASRSQRLLLTALAEEPGRPLAEEYRRRHGLPSASTIQSALAALEERELIARLPDRSHRIAEPFFDRWVRTLAETRPRA